MGLERLELRKLVTNSFVVAAFILLYLLNATASLYVFRNKEAGRIGYTGKEYRQIYKDLGEMGQETGRAYLRRCMEGIARLEKTSGAPRYAGDFRSERMLISDVADNIWNCTHFEEYLDDKIRQCREREASGIVTEYTLRNMERTIRDAEKMRGTALAYGPSRGVEMLCGMMTTDVFVLLFLLIIIVQMVTREREEGELILYKTTCRGRVRLMLSKLMVLFFFVVIATVLFWGINAVFGGLLYGYGNLRRAIQSVDAYISCPYHITVGQFFAIHFLGKLMIYTMLSVVGLLVAVCMKNSAAFYAVMSVLYGVSAVCYFGIHANSAVSFWKYVNAVAFLKTDSIIGVYRNLNFFGIPYSYSSIFVIVALLLTALCIYALIDRFDVQKEATVLDRSKGRLPTAFVQGGFRMLLAEEAYKLFVDGKLLLIIGAYAVFAVVTYQPVDQQFYLAEDSYYDAYIDYLKGPVNGRTESFIKKQSASFDRMLLKDGVDKERLMKSYDAFLRIQTETTPYLRLVHGEYLHDTGYRLLTGDGIAHQKDITLGIMAALILIFPLSYIYGIEYQQNTIILLRTTCKGRGRSLLAKMGLGTLTIILVSIITYLPYYYSVIQKYGMDSLNAPACSLQNLRNVPYGVSIAEYLMFVVMMRFLGYLLMMGFLFACSKRIKSVIKVSLLGVVFVVTPLIFAYLSVPGAEYMLLNPLIIGNVF